MMCRLKSKLQKNSLDPSSYDPAKLGELSWPGSSTTCPAEQQRDTRNLGRVMFCLAERQMKARKQGSSGVTINSLRVSPLVF
jgi:hypothetical protein